MVGAVIERHVRDTGRCVGIREGDAEGVKLGLKQGQKEGLEVAVAGHREQGLNQSGIGGDGDVSEAEATSGGPDRGEGRK